MSDESEWFDVTDEDHLQAFDTLSRTGAWPLGFITNERKLSHIWHMQITCMLADSYMKERLEHE